jgi:hypothetical protein
MPAILSGCSTQNVDPRPVQEVSAHQNRLTKPCSISYATSKLPAWYGVRMLDSDKHTEPLTCQIKPCASTSTTYIAASIAVTGRQS